MVTDIATMSEGQICQEVIWTQFHEYTHVGVGHEHGYEDHMFVLFLHKQRYKRIDCTKAITAIKTNLHQQRATKKEDCFTYHL